MMLWEMIKKCLQCGTPFKTWRCRIKRGEGKYCSYDCFQKDKPKVNRRKKFKRRVELEILIELINTND